jgi:hypothetical protein
MSELSQQDIKDVEGGTFLIRRAMEEDISELAMQVSDSTPFMLAIIGMMRKGCWVFQDPCYIPTMVSLVLAALESHSANETLKSALPHD